MDRSVYDRMNLLEQEHWWFSARREILRTAIDRLVPLPEEPCILEAGCGTGGNLGMLQRIGIVDAFELDPEARQRAAAKSKGPIAGGTLPDELPGAGKTYDLIALFDVLEHVDADSASLQALGARLAPGGRILLTVPAYQWLWSRHDERHHHYRRYTKTTLRRATEKAGLAVEHAFYFNSILFPAALAQRAVKAMLRSEAPDDDMPNPTLNAFLYSVFRSERHLVGRLSMPFGLSLGAVLARRSAE